jgi:hypothetical protein
LLDLQIVLAHGATPEDLLPEALIIGDSISIDYPLANAGIRDW